MGGVLDGRCVVVTGAGRGLGRAYALACAAHGAGVVVNDVDGAAAHAVAAEIAAAGGHAVAEPGSAGSWEVAARLAGTAELEFGRLDGLVANAGITHHAPPWEEDEARLRRITEVNVLGVQFAAVHAMRAMVRRGAGGSIVTVVSGARFGIPGMSAYGATKGAVAAMTAGWARDCASAGIRVNAVSPLAETGMAALDARPDRPALGRARGRGAGGGRAAQRRHPRRDRPDRPLRRHRTRRVRTGSPHPGHRLDGRGSRRVDRGGPGPARRPRHGLNAPCPSRPLSIPPPVHPGPGPRPDHRSRRKPPLK
ncbi:SDR family NAD(P)-dependent oxidoreductase [Microbispora siamensis]